MTGFVSFMCSAWQWMKNGPRSILAQAWPVPLRSRLALIWSTRAASFPRPPMPQAATPDAQPYFWRDADLPFIEVRAISDGRKVRYGRHAHSTFSIGAVTGGRSTYLNGSTLSHVSAGAVVVINPEVVHACNPAADEPWAYRM